MKYQILFLENEKEIGVFEENILDKTTSEIQMGSTYGKHIFHEKNGTRITHPIHFDEKTKSLGVATKLGYCKIQAIRGGKEANSGSQGLGKPVIKSSMPGKILKVLCKPGDKIEKGQAVLIIEAMKMENEIKSSIAAVVKQISVQEGNRVESGALLLEFEAEKKEEVKNG